MPLMFMDDLSWYKYHYPKLMEKYDEMAIELSQCRERAERAEKKLQEALEEGAKQYRRALSVAGKAAYWKVRHDQIAQGNSPANRAKEVAELLAWNGSD